MNLEIGDVIFMDTGTFANKVVQKVTGFEFGHVAISLGGNRMLDVSVGKSSSIITVDELKGLKRAHVCRHPNEYRKLEMFNHIMSLKNIPYDYWAITRIFWKCIFEFKTTRKSKSLTYDIRRIYCSEAVDYIYNQMGIDLVEGEESLISIEDLYYSSELEVIGDGKQFIELKHKYQ